MKMLLLRHSYKIAEIAVLAEREALALGICDQLGISISDQELQAAGNAFRLEHKLLGAFRNSHGFSAANHCIGLKASE